MESGSVYGLEFYWQFVCSVAVRLYYVSFFIGLEIDADDGIVERKPLGFYHFSLEVQSFHRGYCFHAFFEHGRVSFGHDSDALHSVVFLPDIFYLLEVALELLALLPGERKQVDLLQKIEAVLYLVGFLLYVCYGFGCFYQVLF
jgi:hypothetical protein